MTSWFRAVVTLATATLPAAMTGWGAWMATASSAAEMMSAAHASIRAEEAGRHVAALADDSFEGREAGTRGGRAAAAYVVEQIESLGLEAVGDGGTWFQAFGSLRNILALQRGSDPAVAGELVIVGAHYDHVGYGNAQNSNGPVGFVHNGADDNASGVAGLVEVMEAMQRLPTRPRRPILFAFWDGEEKGLLGSRHFLRSRPAALSGMRPVFSVNLDMIGRLRGGRLEVYGTRTSAGLRAAVVEANNRAVNGSGLELAFDWEIEEDSDHHPFIMARIPTVMFHTGLHDQYHRPSDDVHLVNLAGIEPVARLVLGFVLDVADREGPPWRFREEAIAESNASRNRLEAVIPAAAPGHRGRWGIGTREDPSEPAYPIVVRVAAATPAALGGMLPGDRVVAIDGTILKGQADMLARLAAVTGSVSVDVERRGRYVHLMLEETRGSDVAR